MYVRRPFLASAPGVLERSSPASDIAHGRVNGLPVSLSAKANPLPRSANSQMAHASREVSPIENWRIHSGPSSKSALMGQAQQGAELDVAERDAGWVRFVDPATSRTGWIHEGLLTPLRSESVSSTIERPITAAAGEAAKPNAKVPRNGVRPRAASHSAPKQRVGGRRSLSGYAQLPTGEEFRSNKRRFGPFARRRMLREGMLSGDLTPAR